MTPSENILTKQTIIVYRASDLIVTEGVAEGDPLSFADELVMDDTYQLHRSAVRGRLTLAVAEDGEGFLLM